MTTPIFFWENENVKSLHVRKLVHVVMHKGPLHQSQANLWDSTKIHIIIFGGSINTFHVFYYL